MVVRTLSLQKNIGQSCFARKHKHRRNGRRLNDYGKQNLQSRNFFLADHADSGVLEYLFGFAYVGGADNHVSGI